MKEWNVLLDGLILFTLWKVVFLFILKTSRLLVRTWKSSITRKTTTTCLRMTKMTTDGSLRRRELSRTPLAALARPNDTNVAVHNASTSPNYMSEMTNSRVFRCRSFCRARPFVAVVSCTQQVPHETKYCRDSKIVELRKHDLEI